MITLHFNWAETLAIAIVVQAAKDYEHELQRSKKDGRKTGEARRLEKWFMSDYGQLLTFGKGEQIMEKIKKEVYDNGNKRRVKPRID